MVKKEGDMTSKGLKAMTAKREQMCECFRMFSKERGTQNEKTIDVYCRFAVCLGDVSKRLRCQWG